MSTSSLDSDAAEKILWVNAHAGPRQVCYQPDTPMRVTVSTIAFLFFIALTSTLFLRPSELFPDLQGTRIYEGLIIGAFALSFIPMQRHFTFRALKQEPVNICVLGILAATIISHLVHVYLYGAYEAFSEFGKTILYYFILVTTVSTPSRFRGFLWSVAIVGTIMVSLCVIDYKGIHDFKFITHLVDNDDAVDNTGTAGTVLRMRGTGIFQDPNDLCMAIVCCMVLCLYFLTNKKNPWIRWVWLLPIGMLMTGLFYTRSRGGFLALCVAILAIVATRFGKRMMILTGVMGVFALPFVAGRQANLGVSNGGTAHERLMLWREGMVEITSPQILFGIGWDMYADMAGLVAHNSFIHAYVELGLFGGTFFFGAFFFTALALLRKLRGGFAIQDEELARAGPYVGGVLAGWCMSMFSLSRCYIVPTYMIIGMGAVYVNNLILNMAKPRLLTHWDSKHVRLLIFCSLGYFTFLYLFVRVFA